MTLKFPSRWSAAKAAALCAKWTHVVKPSYRPTLVRDIGLALDEATLRENRVCAQLADGEAFPGERIRERRQRLLRDAKKLTKT